MATAQKAMDIINRDLYSVARVSWFLIALSWFFSCVSMCFLKLFSLLGSCEDVLGEIRVHPLRVYDLGGAGLGERDP
jgi:hypothetical protein